MRMYELWKLTNRSRKAVRLEDEAGPVLFERACDAEEYARAQVDFWEAEFQIAPIHVGLA